MLGMLFKPMRSVAAAGTCAFPIVCDGVDSAAEQFARNTLPAQRIVNKGVVDIYNTRFNFGKCDLC